MLQYEKIVINGCFNHKAIITVTSTAKKQVIRVLNEDGGLSFARPESILSCLAQHKIQAAPDVLIHCAMPRVPGYPGKYFGMLRSISGSTPICSVARKCS